MKKIPDSLKSRKFWLAILTAVTLILNEQYNEAVAVIIAYMTIQGASDAVKTYKNPMDIQSYEENLMSQNDEQQKLVTGTGKLRRFDEEEPLQ